MIESASPHVSAPAARTRAVPGERDDRTDSPPAANVVGILLAAGRGARFDPARLGAKLLAAFAGEPVALRAARRLRDAIPRALAVIRPEWQRDAALDELASRLRQAGLEPTICADAEAGMGRSLAWGVEQAIARFDPDGVLIALADMPAVRPDTYRRLLEQRLSDESIIAPRYRGSRGHPVLFGRAHFEALRTLAGDQGAGRLLRQHPVTLVDVDDAGILADVDTLADLEAVSVEAVSVEAVNVEAVNVEAVNAEALNVEAADAEAADGEAADTEAAGPESMNPDVKEPDPSARRDGSTTGRPRA
ncbi:MAG: nucleotidyltransferase family protein [Burkholderiaceae bacterium]